MTSTMRRSGWLAFGMAVAISTPFAVAHRVALAHPMHSEAIERPCRLHAEAEDASVFEGRCSFFVAAGYLVFKLDLETSDPVPAARTVSGAINLGQSTGSVFVTDGAQLAEGAVALEDSSPAIVHMQPGTLARWPNGWALDVGGEATKAQDPIEPLARVEPESVAEVFATYLELGFLHILPRGLDHILFVVGLFLLSPRLGSLLWQISAFTVAHTVTLALGASGLVSLPASVVEPLIAASIVWIAVENVLTDRLHRWRIGVVFLFGLLHGLGFAGVLLEIGFSGAQFLTGLLSFNLGVELGQLSVIAACSLVLGWAMKRPAYHHRVVVPASCAIALVAAYWVVERIGLV